MTDLESRLRRTRPEPDGTATLVPDVARTAVARGMVDGAYAVLDTLVGPLLAVTTPRGLAALHYVRDDLEGALGDVTGRLSPRVVEDPDGLPAVRDQLDAYLAGERTSFDLEIDWQLVRGGFARQVLQAVRRIPYGQVATYSEVAAAAGNPRASRAAGNALGANPVPIVVPCHRVVRTSGGMGGYTGGLDVKRHLLALEGAA